MRFLDKVEKLPDGCWRWIGAISPQGYGHFWWNGRVTTAQRAAYELFVGPIEKGLHTDHTCHKGTRRWCVNPDHVEPVTLAVNTQRGAVNNPWQKGKTHCPSGHKYTSENTYVGKSGSRFCRACARQRTAEFEAREREASPGPGSGSQWASKTHCPNGHEYTKENTYVNPKGSRVCRACKAMRAKSSEWASSDKARSYKTEWARRDRAEKKQQQKE